MSLRRRTSGTAQSQFYPTEIADIVVDFRIAFAQNIEEWQEAIQAVSERFGETVGKELANLTTLSWVVVADQLDLMKEQERELFNVFASKEFLEYLNLLIYRAKMKDALESKARSTINTLMEMPYFRMRNDNSRHGDWSDEPAPEMRSTPATGGKTKDIILPNAPQIEIKTDDHNVVYKLLDPYRHCGNSLNNERMVQFIATQKRPDDGVYLVRQRGGWSQDFWVLLNPEEHRRLLGDIVRLHLSEGEQNWPTDWKRLVKIVGVDDTFIDPCRRYTLAEKKEIYKILEPIVGDEVALHAEELLRINNVTQRLDYIDHIIDDDVLNIMSEEPFKLALKQACRTIEGQRIRGHLGEAERKALSSYVEAVGNMMEPIIYYTNVKWAWFKHFLKEEVDDDLIRVIEEIWQTCNHKEGIVDYATRHVDGHIIAQLATPAFQEALQHAKIKVEGKMLRHKMSESRAKSVIDEMAEFHRLNHPEDDYPGSKYRRRYYKRAGRPDSAKLETPIEVIRIPYDVTTDEVLAGIESFRYVYDYSDSHYSDTYDSVLRLTNGQFRTGDRLVKLDMGDVKTTAANPDKVDNVFMLVGAEEQDALNRFKTELQKIKMSRRLESP